MKLINLHLKGPETYESWTGLRGSVELRDENGNALNITLKPGQISRILASIANELPKQATDATRGVANAINDAIDGGLLLELDGNVTLPHELS